MRGKVWILGGALVLLVMAWLWALQARPRWSVKDPEVLALVEQAEAELGKLYYRDALEVLERAAKRAPDAFSVRYFMVRAYSNLGRPQEAGEQLMVLKSMARDRLTPREKMLLDLLLLRRSGDVEAYLARLLAYQQAYPREVELARLLALAYQRAGQPEETERWGRKILELDANDALAYNILGYAELARGRFHEAEEQFRKYAYIAPDQANPHDSLGELFLITGQWEKAEAELVRATDLNPRFYPAWRHLADLYLLRGQRDKLQQAVDKLARALELPPEEREREQAVSVGLMGFFNHQPHLLEEAAQRLQPPREEWEYFVVHAAALARGQWEKAQKLEGLLAEKTRPGPAPWWFTRSRLLLLLHRSVLQARWTQALEFAPELLRQTSFVTVGQAWVRLLTLRFQGQALQALGRTQEAAQVQQQLRLINPVFPLGE